MTRSRPFFYSNIFWAHREGTFKSSTVNAICSFWQLKGIGGEGVDWKPLKVSETTLRVTTKPLPKVFLWRSLNYYRIPVTSVTSQNFAGLSILTTDINPENFRSITLAIYRKSVKWRKMLDLWNAKRTTVRPKVALALECVIYMRHLS